MFDSPFIAFGGAVKPERGKGLGLRWAGGLRKAGAGTSFRGGGRLKESVQELLGKRPGSAPS